MVEKVRHLSRNINSIVTNGLRGALVLSSISVIILSIPMISNAYEHHQTKSIRKPSFKVSTALQGSKQLVKRESIIVFDENNNKTNNTGSKEKSYDKKDHVKESLCPLGHFECTIDPSLCVPQNAICNGKPDCPDDSDENFCENTFDSKFWDSMFQKRPGADIEVTGTCKYKMEDWEKELMWKNSEISDDPDNFDDTGEDLELINRRNRTLGSASRNEASFLRFSSQETLGGGSSIGCHCIDEKLFCENLYMKNFDGIPTDVVYLDMSGSKFQNFTFMNYNFSQLDHLILRNNKISTILPISLKGLPNLTLLHLTNNPIKRLEKGTFGHNVKLKKLFLGYNQLKTLDQECFIGLEMLEELDLRHNKITEIKLLTFTGLSQLKILHLSYNGITSIKENFLQGLNQLETLSLSQNRIYTIEPGAFQSIGSLRHLYLAWNRLRIVKSMTFCNLRSLLSLTLNHNEIIRIENQAFACLYRLQSMNLEKNRFSELDNGSTLFYNLTELQHIYFDQFWMCGWALHVRSCEPKSDGISSAENMLDNVILRICVWIMGVVGVFGNLFVIVSRMVLREKNKVHSFYIKNLGLADLLMGMFLLSIAFHDVSFRGEFLARQHAWRHSLTCQVSGLLCTLSSEASVVILALITLDRYLSIVRPFVERKNAMIPAILIVITLWTISFLLSWLPMSGAFSSYFGENFYTSNGLCLPLHIHNPFDQGWEYSFGLFVLINTVAFSFIAYAYWSMLRIIQSSSLTIRSTQQKQDGLLTKRFALVVFTDFICWAPVIIVKVVAMSGVSIQVDLYAWLAVFVLPVNSALNPVIYTLTTKLFKQQITHLTISFRKRLGMSTDDSMATSSVYYRNRISRTLNTSVSGSTVRHGKSLSRGESMISHIQLQKTRPANHNGRSSSICQNSQVYPSTGDDIKCTTIET